MNDVKMMAGSSTGKTYVLIARRGDVALGIKLLGIIPAPHSKGQLSYVAARLRSSPYGQDVEHEETSQTVVSMSDAKLTLSGAWPEIEFKKSDNTRCSCIVGFFVRGSLEGDPEKVVSSVLEGDGLNALVDFIYEKAGHDHTVLRRGAVVDWMKAQIQPQLDVILARKKAMAEFEEQTGEAIGVAGFEATQMSKLYKSMNPQVEAVQTEETPAVIKKANAAEADATEEEDEESED